MADYAVGQLVEMKKGHPCGANRWRIIRVGMDFRIKCEKCGRSVLIPRNRFERRVKNRIDE
ncbi:MAG: DUF951 domain-containing protein [Bacillota bacterium]|nr:DUF951 domain-containing protein [Bacillota bacterium]MDW7729029.1 DUF951 domain-containing protein [Bacillota bacterium]